MTYQEFLRQLEIADMSVKEFARLIKRTPNAITNYATKDEVPAHLAIISTLCAYMHVAGQDYRAIISSIDFHGVKPREDGVKGFRGKKATVDELEAEEFMGKPIPY